HGQYQRLDEHQTLQQEDQAALVHPIGDDAAVEGEQQNRKRAHGRHQAHGEGGVGELQDQPSLSDRLNPGSKNPDELTEKKQPEIAVAGGGEDGADGGGGWHGGGR